MSPRALITGGAGFIGSHLAERLLDHEYRVTVLDDLSTGAIANLAHLPEGDGLTFVGGSITDAATVSQLVRQADQVFHLAASVGVKRIVDSPIESISTNIRGTEVLLEASARFDKPTIIASTSEVYGKSSKIPFSEDDDLVLGPTRSLRWSYAASKAIDEFLALAYVRDAGLPATIVRLFNTVGRRQTGRYGMVIPRFVKQALKGDPITVHGDGAQRRAFAHVSDAVGAIHKLSLTPEATGQVFNVGNDVEISIYELAELVRDRAKSDSEIITIPYEQAFGMGFEDIRRRVPDLAKVRSVIGYEPTWTIEEIVDDVVDFFREQAGSG
jgi:UDP-glucose 4-epimerase